MKFLAYSATLLFAASFVSASPVPQQQQQQQQQERQQCTMDMLQGFMITSPVNFEAEPQEFLPERGQFIDPTKTTILISDQQDGDQNKTIHVKFTNDTEISTEILQNSIFAISWKSTNQSQQAQRQMIRVQLVDQDGKLFNATETLGVLSTGGQQQQQQAGQNQTSTTQVQAAQQQQGNQTAVTQPPAGNQTSQQQQGQKQMGQEGAIVVYLGPEIEPRMYAFLLSVQVRPQQQAGQQQQQQGALCRMMTTPFRVRPVSALQQSET